MNIRIKKLFWAYREFDLQVEDMTFEGSKITSVVGPNGAGKTTLIKCLGAILPVERNSIFVNGKDISQIKGAERARLMSYVPQEHGSAFNYSVLDFVLMGRAAYLSLLSTPDEEDTMIAQEALEYVGLAGYAFRPYFQLSSGERRLVLIARALAQNPEILLLDEPTTFLDPKHEVEILSLCKKLAGEKGKTVLITLHNLDMALKFSQEMVFMKKGRVVASGKPEEILTESLLKMVYEVPMRIIEESGTKIIVR